MKKGLILVFAILIGLFLLSCKGETGPAGAQGVAGKPLYVKMFQNNVYPDSSYQNITDNFIFSYNPNNNFGNCEFLTLASNISDKARVIIKFGNLDNFIPANATITNAYLVLYGYNMVTYTASSIRAYSLLRNWTEGTGGCGSTATTNSSWNNYSGTSAWTNPGGDFDETPVSDAVAVNTFVAYHSLKLDTNLVKKWIQSPTTNYGVLVKLLDETKDCFLYLAASENTYFTWSPKLVVYYTIP